MTVDIVGFVYAGVVAAGGIMGYAKAGSVPSLAAGLIFGGALGYGAYQMSIEPPNYVPQLVTTSILAGVMGYRFYNSGKMMPAGMVCIISVAMIVKIGLGASGLLAAWFGTKTKGNNDHNVTYEPNVSSTTPSATATTEI